MSLNGVVSCVLGRNRAAREGLAKGGQFGDCQELEDSELEWMLISISARISVVARLL